jgi:hypothetical protein
MTSYLLILRRDQSQSLRLAHEEMLERFTAWTRSLQEQGVLRAVERLMPASEGTTVQRHEGEATVGGAYESEADMIGFYLLELANEAAAQAIAKECPILAEEGSVEIRQTQSFLAPESGDGD